MLCAFETFIESGTYERLIFLRSFLIEGSDTLAWENKWVTRTIYVVADSASCPSTAPGCDNP